MKVFTALSNQVIDDGKGIKPFLKLWMLPGAELAPSLSSGRSLEPSGHFLELLIWQNWVTKQEGPCWPRAQRPLQQSYRNSSQRWEYLPERQPSEKCSINQAVRKTTPEFGRHLKESERMRKQFSVGRTRPKLNSVGRTPNAVSGRKPSTAHQLAYTIVMVKHGVGSIVRRGRFSPAGTGRCRSWGNDEYSLIQRGPWRKPERFSFQHDSNPKHASKTTLAWLQVSQMSLSVPSKV